MLSLAAIQGAKLETKVVKVAAWDGEVTIQKLSVTQRDELAGFFTSEDLEIRKEGPARTIIAAVTDGDKPIFNESHLALLNEQDGVAMTELFEEIMDFNKMRKKDEPELVKP